MEVASPPFQEDLKKDQAIHKYQQVNLATKTLRSILQEREETGCLCPN